MEHTSEAQQDTKPELKAFTKINAIDLPPPLSELNGRTPQMTLLAAQGIRRLAQEQKERRKLTQQVFERAVDLFDSRPDGITETDLVDMLESEGFSLSLASSGVDGLRSSGRAQKDWKTGFLSHV